METLGYQRCQNAGCPPRKLQVASWGWFKEKGIYLHHSRPREAGLFKTVRPHIMSPRALDARYATVGFFFCQLLILSLSFSLLVLAGTFFFKYEGNWPFLIYIIFFSCAFSACLWIDYLHLVCVCVCFTLPYGRSSCFSLSGDSAFRGLDQLCTGLHIQTKELYLYHIGLGDCFHFH